jgi:hypothetical protein
MHGTPGQGGEDAAEAEGGEDEEGGPEAREELRGNGIVLSIII